MIELYKKINDRKINKTVSKIMNPKRKDDWKYFRIGVKMRGGGFDLAKDIIIRELEFMNTKPYEELLSYNPKKFMEALGGTRWAKSALKCYPGASHEYMYIGKYLSKYKDENGLLDMDSVNRHFKSIEKKINLYSKEICVESIKKNEGMESILEQNDELAPFFPHASEVYVCDESKTIAVFFEFRVMFYEPKRAGMRLDWSRYDEEYYVKDANVLNKQLEKIRLLSEEMDIPGKDDPAGFIYWANTNVTKADVEKILSLYNSIPCGSLQYFRECKEELLKSKLAEKYKKYTIRSITTTYDPFCDNKRCNVGNYKVVSDDFSNNQTYMELYD